MEKKKINLQSEVSYITQDCFKVEEFYGTDRLFFIMSKKQSLIDSTTYTVVTHDFLPAPTDRDNTRPCVRDVSDGYEDDGMYHKFLIDKDVYIAAARGGRGFECPMQILSCEVTEYNDSFDLIVKQITNPETVEKVCGVVMQNEHALSTCFTEKVYEKLRKDYYYINPRVVLTAFESTDFFRMPEDGVYAKCAVGLCADGEFSLSVNYHSNTHLKFVDGSERTVRCGDFLYRTCDDLIDYLEILEVKGIFHDIYANFSALAKVILRYPADAAEIESRFPEFYKSVCRPHYRREMQLRLDLIPEVPHINDVCELGAKTIYQKLDCSQIYSGIQRGLFMFSYNPDLGLVIAPMGLEKSQLLRIGAGGIYCTIIEADGLYNIIGYRYTRCVKYQDDYYAVFEYNDETGFCDWTDPLCISRNQFRTAMFLTFQGQITPISVSRAEYEQRRDMWRKDINIPDMPGNMIV